MTPDEWISGVLSSREHWPAAARRFRTRYHTAVSPPALVLSREHPMHWGPLTSAPLHVHTVAHIQASVP